MKELRRVICVCKAIFRVSYGKLWCTASAISKSQQYTYDYTSLVVMKPNKSKHILNTLDKNAFVTQGFIQIYEILTC